MPRTRIVKETAGSLLEQIQAKVDQLIEENKALKKEIARHQSNGAGDLDRRSLTGMHRRLEAALGAPARRPRAAAARRKVTDPEVLEKRRAALAKARSALAERRAAAKA